MTDRELMQMAMETIQGCRPSSKSYKQMREAVEALRDRLAQPESDCKPDFDLLFEANSADIEALTDAQFTLEAIKSADPGTHNEIIDASLRLIKVALSKSVFGPLESIAGRIGAEL
jgi:hypothetical protein